MMQIICSIFLDFPFKSYSNLLSKSGINTTSSVVHSIIESYSDGYFWFRLFDNFEFTSKQENSIDWNVLSKLLDIYHHFCINFLEWGRDLSRTGEK